MFVDEAGWGWPRDPAPKRVLTERQSRIVMRLVLMNLLLLVVAPIGGVTIIEAVVAVVAHRH